MQLVLYVDRIVSTCGTCVASLLGYSRVAVATSHIGSPDNWVDIDPYSDGSNLARVLALIAATTTSASSVPVSVCT